MVLDQRGKQFPSISTTELTHALFIQITTSYIYTYIYIAIFVGTKSLDLPFFSLSFDWPKAKAILLSGCPKSSSIAWSHSPQRAQALMTQLKLEGPIFVEQMQHGKKDWMLGTTIIIIIIIH